MLKQLKERRQSEEGFTLIELMVVVLIMGILMAIAIPTFLATRGSANDAAAKSNATNAFTNEKAYYASNQVFVTADTAGDTLDDSLPWGAVSATADQGNVEAVASEVSSSTTDNAVVVEALSKSGNCFYILDEENSSSAIIGYAVSSGGCSTFTPSGTETISTSASSSPVQSLASGTTEPTWYQAW